MFVFNDTIISRYVVIYLLGGLFVNWKTFLIGVGAGVATGIVVNQTVTNNREISSEKALDIAKSAFKKHGPIQGSWIQMEKQPYHKSFLQFKSNSPAEFAPGFLSSSLDKIPLKNPWHPPEA